MHSRGPEWVVSRVALLVLVSVLCLIPVAAGGRASTANFEFCGGTYCNIDTDCWAACPGGAGSSYCYRAQHECYPY